MNKVFSITEYSFTLHTEETCTAHLPGDLIIGNTENHDNCKKWCVARDNCGGFILQVSSSCIFKGADCKNNVRAQTGALLVLKTLN